MTCVVAILTLMAFATGAHAQIQPDESPFTMDGALDADVGDAIPDPHANSQELGPVNGSNTKINPINTATPPMLDFTNPNGQVDLGTVWLATRKNNSTGDIWLYFAWSRPDSNSGSGFITLDFMKNALDQACNYTGVNFVKPPGNQQPNAATAALIATCNPWRNRSDRDFGIHWDQNGNTLEISDIQKRTYTCTTGNLPNTPETCTLGEPNPFDPDDVGAAISGTRFFGELAINLTDAVFGADAGCENFANVIPGTVTGNSDQAEYKDTVFFHTDPITNCGVLRVTKLLVDAAGNSITDSNNPVFTYKVDRLDGTDLYFESDWPAGKDLTQIESKIQAGVANTQEWSLLIAGGNYRLQETVVDPNYQLKSVVCYDGTNVDPDTEEDLGNDITASPYGPFTVAVPNGIEATLCVITNEFLKTTPSATSTQRVVVFDTITINGINPGAANASNATVKIFLYADANCSIALGETSAISLSGKYNDAGTSATVNTIDVPITPAANTLGNIFNSPGGVWWWAFAYSGDSFNSAISETQSCGFENGTAALVETGFSPQ
jgi:hypothetical protein